jgi:hypothetical protein
MFKQYLAGANIKNKEKSKNYHTVGTFPKSNRKIVEKGKTHTPYTQIHDHSLSWQDKHCSLKGMMNVFTKIDKHCTIESE